MSQKINDFSKLALFAGIPQDNASSVQSQLIEQIARSSFDSLKALYAEFGPEAKTLSENALDLKKVDVTVKTDMPSFFTLTTSFSNLSEAEKNNLVRIVNKKSHYSAWPVLRILFEEFKENQDFITQKIDSNPKLQKYLKSKNIIHSKIQTVLHTPCISYINYAIIEDQALEIFQQSQDSKNQLHILTILEDLRSYTGITEQSFTFITSMKRSIERFNIGTYDIQKKYDLTAHLEESKITIDLLISLLRDKQNHHFLCIPTSATFLECPRRLSSIKDFLPIFESTILIIEKQKKMEPIYRLLQKTYSKIEAISFLEEEEKKDELKIKKYISDLVEYSKELIKISGNPLYIAYHNILGDLHNFDGFSGSSIRCSQDLVIYRELLYVTNLLLISIDRFYNSGNNFISSLDRIIIALPFARWHKLSSNGRIENLDLQKVAKKICDIHMINFSEEKIDLLHLNDPIDLFFGMGKKTLKNGFESASKSYVDESTHSLPSNEKPPLSWLDHEKLTYLKYFSVENFLSKNLDKNSYYLRIKEIHSEFLNIINDLPLRSRTKKLEKEIQELFTKCFERHIIEGLILHDYEYSCHNKILPLSKIIPEEILEMTFFSFPKIFEPEQTSSATEASSVREFDPERYQSPQPNDIEDEEDDTEEYENTSLNPNSTKPEIHELTEEETELLQDLKEATNYRETMYVLKKYHRYLKKSIFTKADQLPLLSKFEENRISKSGHAQVFGVTVSTHDTNIPQGTRNSMSSQLRSTMIRIHEELSPNKNN